jgi:hypothetical protein
LVRGWSVALWFLAAAATLVLSPGVVAAAPTISTSISTSQARKGQSFHVLVDVSTDEDIENLEVTCPVVPSGFTVELLNKKVPSPLSGAFVADFLVSPPGFSWWSNAAGSDTREQKILAFDIAYDARQNGTIKRIHRSTRVTFPYALGPVLYMLTGILGVILGNVIKTLTSHKKDLVDQLGSSDATGSPLLRTIWNIAFRREVVGLMTSVAIGFVVLLVLARGEIPTKGWYDSLALGVSLAILADDQLLTKVKII